MKKWNFPTSLVINNNPAQEIDEWDVVEELHRQHNLLMEIVDSLSDREAPAQGSDS